MPVATVFRKGRSLAIRLAKEFRADADTAYLNRTGEGVPRDHERAVGILLRGSRAAFRQVLGQPARSTRVGITGLMAELYNLDADMKIGDQ